MWIIHVSSLSNRHCIYDLSLSFSFSSLSFSCVSLSRSLSLSDSPFSLIPSCYAPFLWRKASTSDLKWNLLFYTSPSSCFSPSLPLLLSSSVFLSLTLFFSPSSFSPFQTSFEFANEALSVKTHSTS